MSPTPSPALASPDRAADRWLRALSRPASAAGFAALALPLTAGLLLVPQCWLLAGVLDAAIMRGAAPAEIAPGLAALAAVMLTRAALGMLGEIVATHAGETIKATLRRSIVDSLLARAPIWTASRASGQLAGAAVEQVDALEGYLMRYLPAMLQAALLPLAFAAVVFPVDWVVALLFLFTAPLIPVFMALVGWGAEAASRQQAGALVRLSAYFGDRLRGLVTLKLFGRAEAEIAGVRVATDELGRRTMRVMRIAFLSSAVLEFFAALGVAGVALYVGLTLLGLVTVHAGELTLAAGLFCLLVAPEVYQPLRLLAAHYHDRASARAAVTEIEAALGSLPKDRRPVAAAAAPAGAVPAPRQLPLGLRLGDVSVSTPAGRPVLAGISLDLVPGSHHAILGPSGSGKSSLIEAIARLREHGGSIRLGGHELGTIDETMLRAGVAMLGQRPRIFAGSIADNIRLARPDACDTALRCAARRACVDCFADLLPLGLDTPVGEHGLGLSGGEIQRVALARLYLRDPGLVIADEPTAHLDRATEAKVLDGLIGFAARRTLLVVTHSEAVAARMDHAWRLVDGQLLKVDTAAGAALARGAA